MGMFREEAREARAIREQLEGAAEAHERLTAASVGYAKASLQVAPPLGPPVLVSPSGAPISSGAGGGGGSALVSGGNAGVRTTSTPTEEPAGSWVPDPITGQWVWRPTPRRVSARGSGGGGGVDGGASGYGEARREYYSGKPGEGAGLGELPPSRSQFSGKSLTTGEAVIAGELRGLRQDIRNLSRDDNGAQLRRRGEL